MKHNDNNITFAEVWASLRQPGSQWVMNLLARKLQNNTLRIPVDSAASVRCRQNGSRLEKQL